MDRKTEFPAGVASIAKIPPRFLYFDLGNVLLNFDHRLACRQVADVAGISPELVWNVVFESGLQRRYEAGEISTAEFFETFCAKTKTRPAQDALAAAAGAIFQVNASMKAVLTQLWSAGYRLGLLSNTCEIHWDYFSCGRYCPIPDVFEVVALSFRLRALKPDPKIFIAAAELARVAPGEIFYVDDIGTHVDAARKVGFDAVQYTTTSAFVADLRKRGLRFNY